MAGSMGAMVGRGFVMVSPSMRGFRRAVSSEMSGAGREGAKRFGAGFGAAGRDTGSKAGRGFKDAFRSGSANVADSLVKELQRDVAAASKSLATARLRQQDAAGRVRVAEARLAEAIQKTGAGSARAVAAEESLASARRKHQVATDAVTAASNRLKTAQQAVGEATGKLSSGGGFESFGSTARAALGGVADAAGRAGAAIARGIGDGIQAASKAAAVGMAAIGTQMVAAVKGSVAGFADYEQAVGGIDTLFKDASGKVQKYAADAFSTAGVSANDYMSQVTSFSASLIGSLGGDTEAAADLANQAMIDMSDNANKMGTDMASIQGTYQSLARGNYAMLDNLKLGYGGTKAEMERLLADAEKLSGKKYSGDNFADIVSAIHVVQEELGITGTTALEAEETISGSANAMKASWSNWLTELAKTGGDVDGVTKQLASSVGTWLGNIGPVIKQAVTSLVQSIPMLLSSLVDSLPAPFQAAFDRVGGVFSGFQGQLGPLMAGFGALGTAGLAPLLSNLPVVGGLFDGLAKKLPFLTNPLFLAAAGLGAFAAAGGDFGAVADGVTGVVDSIVAALPGLIEKAVEVIPQFVESILAALPQLLDAGTQILDSLIEGVIVALPMLVEGAVELLNGLVTGLVENLPMLIEAALQLVTSLQMGFVQALPLLVQGAITLITGLVQGLVQNLPLIIQAAIQLMQGLMDGFVQGFPLLIDAALQIIAALVQGITDNLALIIQAALQLVMSLVAGLIENLPALIEATLQLMFGIVDALMQNLPALIDAGIRLVFALATGLVDAFPELIGQLPELIGRIVDSFMGMDWIGLGADIIGGIVQGIGDMAGKFIDVIIGLAQDAWDSIIGFFGIASPSRLMRDTVGKQLPAGLAVGVEAGTGKAVAAARRMSQATADAAQTTATSAHVATGQMRAGTGTPVSVHQEIHAAPGMSEYTVGEIAVGRFEKVLGGVS